MSLVGDAVDGKKKICLELKIKGIVQGVGFRPFVYRLAQEYQVNGLVRNESGGVLLQIEGEQEQINAFYKRLTQDHPPLAKIDSIEQRVSAVCGYKGFIIDLSRTETDKSAVVPPDIATCIDCLDEIRQVQDRHYRYAFTNCTNCGPRFTITESIPYDRANTPMKKFPPCTACAAEYNQPSDRRFHAQPVACPLCGPRIEIINNCGKPVAGDENWQEFVWEQISQGSIFAVKSLGGYQLACAVDEAVITKLRERKNRPAKPFAVMFRDLKTISKYCRLNKNEADWLASAAAPILLLTVNADCPLPGNISPHLSTCGVMLPYTPLHHLIMQGPFEMLVLTSANRSGLPMAIDNNEVLAQLGDTADYFLMHNRDIVQRCDDSVARVIDNRIQVHRRSRGFTPKPVDLNFTSEITILGAGAEMKNTFCLLKGNQAYLSQHMGEMGTVEAEKAYLDSLNHFKNSFNMQAQVVAYDPHPQYCVSDLARKIDADRHYSIYHHHAHFVSCLAENGHLEKAVGAILDGTGFGTDGAIWGFEIISGDCLDFTRSFHQRYISMPGGESAVQWPWRMALSYLRQAMGSDGLTAGRELFERHFMREFEIVSKQIETGMHSVPSASCGRLFDAVAAVLGVCLKNTYEGQAAVQLGEILGPRDVPLPLDPYSFTINGKEIDFSLLFPELLTEIKNRSDIALMARRFHDTVISAVIETVKKAADQTGIRTVALSGGTWLNPYLTEKTKRLLTAHKLEVLLHSEVPPNDAGLSLGQATAAYWRWKKDVPGNSDDDTAY